MESENVNSTAAAAAGTVQSSETPMEVKCAKAESAAAAASAKESAAIIDYVLVAENDDPTTDRMELPTQPEDGSLGLSTLTHAYPGAQGLKYKNPQTGASRALLVDSSGTRFMPPSGGWADKVFYVIFPQQRTTSEANNPKRKKLMDEDDGISDDGTEGRGFSGGGSKQKRFDSSVDVTTSDSASGGGDMTVEHERAGAVCVDLIVLGISYKASEQTVKAYFETYGEVVMFDLKKDATGNSKGFGFVRMKDYDAQSRILAKGIHEIDGRRCEVKIPLSRGEVSPPVVTRVFLGRVPETMTADDLRTFFNEEAAKIDPDAKVTDVYIPRPFRSFAFVNFSSGLVAAKLISKGDYVVKGSSLAVCAAAPREYSDYSPRMAPKGNYAGGGSYIRKIATASPRYDSYSARQQQQSSGSGGGYYDGGGSPYNGPMGIGGGSLGGGGGLGHGHGGGVGGGGRWVDQGGPGGGLAGSPGAYRGGLEGRMSANRFSPGYATSAPPRYAASMQQQQRQQQNPPHRGGGAGGVGGTSQALASGLDALSLNKMNNVNPEVMDAAWHAFWTTLNSGGGAQGGGGGGPQGGPPHGVGGPGGPGGVMPGPGRSAAKW